LKIAYYWKKELKLDNSSGIVSYVFSKPVKEKYVILGKMSRQYQNNREFVDAFPVNCQKQLYYFMRTRRIKVRKASDSVMYELAKYGISLLKK